MELVEIKKLIYKINRPAQFDRIKKGFAYYSTSLLHEGIITNVTFAIPIADMGDAEFLYDMPAKHLIRWIVNID